MRSIVFATTLRRAACAPCAPFRLLATSSEHATPPEALADEGAGTVEEDALRLRRAAQLRTFLETRLGSERASLVRLLSRHRVACPGGQEGAHALLESLLVWKAAGVATAGEGGAEKGSA